MSKSNIIDVASFKGMLMSTFGKDETQYLNSIAFTNLFARIYNICINMFKWNNLPETCDVDFLEDALFWFGRAIFYRDKNNNIFSLRSVESGTRNIYNKPLSWTAYGFNGYSESVKLTSPNGLYGENGVLIRANKLMFPTANIIYEYVLEICNVKRTRDVNLDSIKTPTFLIGDEETQRSLNIAMKKIHKNYGFIMLKSEIARNIEVKDSTKAYIGDKLTILKHDILSDLLSFLGIQYVSTEKKERLITDEVNMSLMYTLINKDQMLNVRQQACQYFNQVFKPKNPISVEYNYEYLNELITKKENKNEEEIENV